MRIRHRDFASLFFFRSVTVGLDYFIERQSCVSALRIEGTTDGRPPRDNNNFEKSFEYENEAIHSAFETPTDFFSPSPPLRFAFFNNSFEFEGRQQKKFSSSDLQGTLFHFFSNNKWQPISHGAAFAKKKERTSRRLFGDFAREEMSEI